MCRIQVSYSNVEESSDATTPFYFFLSLIIYGGLLIYVGGSFVLVVTNQGKLEVSISTSQQTFKFVIFIIKLTFNNLFL